jgi:hypothetical protein
MTEKQFEVQCNVCDETFSMKHSPEERVDCTVDCPKCGALLICLEGGTTAEFHHWLNAKHPYWPADGKGTGYAVIFDEEVEGGVYDG